MTGRKQKKTRTKYRTVTMCALCGGEDVYRDTLVHCNIPGHERDDGDHWCDDCEDSCDVVMIEVPEDT